MHDIFILYHVLFPFYAEPAFFFGAYVAVGFQEFVPLNNFRANESLFKVCMNFACGLRGFAAGSAGPALLSQGPACICSRFVMLSCAYFFMG